MKFILLFLVLFGLAPWSCADTPIKCPAPPILTKQHALCFAWQYKENPPQFKWRLDYEIVEESERYWVVRYSREAAAGGGHEGYLRIEKATGGIIFLRGSYG
jgi:hypothetical protein